MQNLADQVHPEWREMISHALAAMDREYLSELQRQNQWLPGINRLLAAFNLPLSSTRYVLLGESPYPRAVSANGYAFWDAAVGTLWSPSGLSKEVNRATSLRNLMKMMLFARGDLTDDFSQPAIASLVKSHYIQTGSALFGAFINKGFLLLNASLVYREKLVPYDAKQWRPFIHTLLSELSGYNPSLKLILFGRIAQQTPETQLFPSLMAEHPYNITFITNPAVVEFFKPLDLLRHDY